MATIKLENLVKTYGEVEVLHNVNGAIKAVSYTHLTLPTSVTV